MSDEQQSETNDEHPEMTRASAEVDALVPSEPHAEDDGDTSDEPCAAEVDAPILHAALVRLARLHGVNIPGEHAGDIDMTGLSPEYVQAVEWARTMRVA
jgi:hypothetical protein